VDLVPAWLIQRERFAAQRLWIRQEAGGYELGRLGREIDQGRVDPVEAGVADITPTNSSAKAVPTARCYWRAATETFCSSASRLASGCVASRKAAIRCAAMGSALGIAMVCGF
jgi:hypothetical protein